YFHLIVLAEFLDALPVTFSHSRQCRKFSFRDDNVDKISPYPSSFCKGRSRHCVSARLRAGVLCVLILCFKKAAGGESAAYKLKVIKCLKASVFSLRFENFFRNRTKWFLKKVY